ncbi:MAG: DNA translocase FtsK 4TM domain-containing protein, partial [Bacteroidales bacterium]|nr:DNA translocase FtsK 4TM domain-containing protein [Bacteroidales bacterium]
MAKKKSVAAEIAPPPKGIEAVKLITGLFFAALSVYTFVALISYVFTWAEDQSLLSRPDVWSTIVPVENGAGKLGFFWANFLVSRLFGLGAFIIPFFFAAVAIFSLKIKKVSLLRQFFLSAYGAIILSLLFSFVFGFTRFDDWFGNGAGGSYGYFVNRWLIGMLGVTGAGAVIIVLFVTWLVLISYKVVEWFGRAIAAIFHPKRREEVVIDDTFMLDDSAVLETTADDVADSEVIEEELTPDDGKQVLFEIEKQPDVEVDKKGAELPKENLPPFEVIESVNDDEEDFLKDLPKGSLDTLFDPRLDLAGYQIPPLSLLDDYKERIFKVPADELEKNNRKIVKTLSDYKISVEKIFARTGPTVTLYEIVPSAGVRISQIKRLEDDIALSLAARGV